MRVIRIAGLLAFALSTAIAILAVIFYLSPNELDPVAPPEAQALMTSVMALYGLIGFIIVFRIPHNRFGWLLLLFSLFALAGSLSEALLAAGRIDRSAYDTATSFIDSIVPALIGLAFIVFPNGKLPSRRWFWAVWLIALIALVGLLGALGLVPREFPASDLGAVSVIIGLVAPVTRWRRARTIERQQLKLVSAASLLTLIAVASSGLGQLGGPTSLPMLLNIFFLIAIATLALSIGAAVLRYRLFDVDRIISRTVTYALVVGLLGLVILGLVAGMATFLPSDDPLVVAVATLTVFALFNPLRVRVQRVVDRRFNRSRYDAEQVIDDFSGSLRERVDPENLVAGWVEVVEDTMQPVSVGVWVRHE